MRFCKNSITKEKLEVELKKPITASSDKVNGRLTSNANPYCYLLGVRAYLKVLMTRRKLKEDFM